MLNATSNVKIIAGDDRLYCRLAWRIMPILFASYIIAYMDRVNVGFAKLQMMDDLRFDEATYGIGAGLFFIGYFIFEIPSNIILQKVGARVWIFRIMSVWGVVSALTAFVTTPREFYAVRAMLGVAEAGFFPGIVLYLTQWFPSDQRGKMMALLMAGNPVAGIIGGPLSGGIMNSLAGYQGFAGWRWMYVIEGMPAVLVALAVYVWLDDRIAVSRWLAPEEKAYLAFRIEAETNIKQPGSTLSAFKSRQVWLMCAILFGIIMGSYGVGFWQPTIIKRTGVKDDFTVGLLTMIPYTMALISMLLTGRHADKTGERRLHVILPTLVAGVGFLLLAQAGGSTLVSLIGLSLAASGAVSALPMFWALPTSILGEGGAAAGIALINCTGNLAGFVSPSFVGYLKNKTGSLDSGLYLIAASLFTSALLIVFAVRTGPRLR